MVEKPQATHSLAQDYSHTAQCKSSKWQLRLILLVTFVPLAAAYIVYYTGWGMPKNTVNYGLLLNPALDVNPLFKDEKLFSNSDTWRLVLPVLGECDSACEHNLFVSRQVHIRLGDKAGRVERIALPVGEQAEKILADKIKDHPRLASHSITDQQWQNWLSQSRFHSNESIKHYYFLVDPQGFAMLLYDDGISGNELLKDIKRVLRFSPEQ